MKGFARKHKQDKRDQALDRQAARDNRTDEQQLQLIATRRGKSFRETAKLMSRPKSGK